MGAIPDSDQSEGTARSEAMGEFLASLDPLVVYTVVALFTFGESAAFLSLVLPGEVTLVAAAALGATSGVDPVLLAGIATVGALTGGMLGYAIGRRYGPKLVAWDPIRRRIGDRMATLHPMVSGPEAGALVAVARFNQITRALVPALAGMASMGRVRFAVANGVGALLWSTLFTGLGYYAGEWWQSTSGLVHVVMVLVVVSGGGWWLLARRGRQAG